MIHVDEVTFPLTVEAFTALQEEWAGRNLTDGEKEVTAAWVPYFNEVYQDGLQGDTESMSETLDKLEALLSERTGAAKRVLLACALWIARAWRCGGAEAIL